MRKCLQVLEIIDKELGEGAWRELERQGRLKLEDFADARGLTLADEHGAAFILADEVQNVSQKNLALLCSRFGAKGTPARRRRRNLVAACNHFYV